MCGGNGGKGVNGGFDGESTVPRREYSDGNGRTTNGSMGGYGGNGGNGGDGGNGGIF